MDRFWNADSARRKHPHSRWRMVLYEVIFESDTRAGKYFDVILILSIGLSVLVVMLKSLAGLAVSPNTSSETLMKRVLRSLLSPV